MAMTKLTLSADTALIADAKRLASDQQTSVSAMFAKFLRSFAQIERHESPDSIGPLTRRASGLIHLPKNRSDQELLEDALASKHRATR